MPVYNKLVRDRIPEIIEKDQKTCHTIVLDAQRFEIELKRKLEEELLEYKQASSNEEALEELADILELMHALAEVHEADMNKVEEIRQKKAAVRGGFKNRIFLVEVEDE